MLNFNNIQIQGFGSIGNCITFPLDKKGINLIKGRNGAGKTSIFNALAWCCYGTNLKGITNGYIPTWREYRPANYKGTRVVLFLQKDNDTYCIVRHLKFKGTSFGIKGDNSLMLLKNTLPTDLDSSEISDKFITTELFKRNQQEYIDRLIGMDYKVFINSILFGQRMTRLISASGSEKRTIFEEIFDTIYISEAREIAKNGYDELTTKIESAQSEIKGYEREIEILSDQLVKGIKALNEFEENKQALVVRKASQVEQLEQKLEDITADYFILEANLPKQQYKLKQIEELINNFDSSDLNIIRQNLKEAKKGLEGTQSEYKKCGLLKGNIGNKIQTLQMEYAQYIDKRTKLIEQRVQRIDKEEKALEQVVTTCYACGKPIDPSNLEEVKASIQKEIDKFKDELLTLQSDTQHEGIQKEEGEQLKKLDKLQGQIDILLSDIDNRKQSIDNLIQQEEESSKGLFQLERDKINLTNELTNLEKEIKAIKTRGQDYEALIEQNKKDLEASKAMTPPSMNFQGLKLSIAESKTKIGTLYTELESFKINQDRYKFWYSKGFSSSGMSSYIFGVMMDELNACTHKYAQRVGLSIKMGIDLNMKSKPFYTKVLLSDGLEVNHAELSGGEQQLVDVCIAFGTQELVSKYLPLLILDEVFEGLDSENIAKVFDFVRLKVEEGKDVYIITHQANLDFKYTKTIEIEKVEKMTRVCL